MIVVPLRRVAFACLLLFTSCKVTHVSPITFPADYHAAETGAVIETARACATIRSLVVTDERPDKRTVGRRAIQDKPDRSDILMDGDVRDWLRLGLQRALDRAGIATSSSARFELAVKLVTLSVEEVAYRNSTFDGKLILDLELRQPDGNPAVWSSRADGTSDNYGRPGNPVNYQETINEALDLAAIKVVNNEEFRRVLCGTVD